MSIVVKSTCSGFKVAFAALAALADISALAALAALAAISGLCRTMQFAGYPSSH